MTPLQAKSLALLNLQNRDANEAAREQRYSDLRATLIADSEIENIIEAAIRTRVRVGRGITTDELQKLINTIIAERYAAGLSEMAGKGILDVEFDPTKPPGQQINYEIRADLEPELRAKVDQMIHERCQTKAEALEGA